MVQTRSQKVKEKAKDIPKKKKGSVTHVIKKKPVKYNSVITEIKNFSNVTETTMQISRTNGKGIDVDEFENIYAGIRRNTDSKLVVRALNGQRWYTFKGYSDDELNIDSFEDYYKNKVSETGKFENFSIIQITSLKSNKKNKKIIN
jgi:hypothetical protein